MTAAWRQVFVEAGGQVPLRNIERMLAATHVPVDSQDQRRLDLIVPGLNVSYGRPLFCDLTIISPITRQGLPRPGTSNYGGRLLEAADQENVTNYEEVVSSGLGALYSLGCEVYGRWSSTTVSLVADLARERARGLHPRIRRGSAMSFQHRWWGILPTSLQRAVVNCITAETGDLYDALLEPIPSIADLPAET